MEQKMNGHSLREMYFNNPHAENSINIDASLKEQQVKQKADDRKAYRKFSPEEISHFESLFNQHHEKSKRSPEPAIDPIDDFNPIDDDVKEERIELPVASGKTLGQMFDRLATKVELDSPFSTADHASSEDLDYLNALVTNKYPHEKPNALPSIGDIFDEIVGNEQNNTTNYCSKTFDANVQHLFDEDPEEELNKTSTHVDLTEEIFFPEEKKIEGEISEQLVVEKQMAESRQPRKRLDWINVILLLLIFVFLGILGYLVATQI